MAQVFERCGEDIGVTTILQLKSFAEISHRQREVPHGNIRMCHSCQTLLQVSLVH